LLKLPGPEEPPRLAFRNVCVTAGLAIERLVMPLSAHGC